MKARRGKKWNREEIMRDELMAATIGDIDWLRLSLDKAKGKVAIDRNGYNAMHLAALHGRVECLQVLIEEYHMDVNMPDAQGRRPIHMILNKESGYRANQSLQYLLEIGADPNVQTVDGQTPLHQAAEVGLLDCLQTLVEAAADVKAQNTKGQTPLDLAKVWGHRICTRYLADLVWKANGTEYQREMQKLQRLKVVLFTDEKRLYNMQQEEQELMDSVRFGQWLERKGLLQVARVSPALYRPRRPAQEEMLTWLRDALVEKRGEGARAVRVTRPREPCRPRPGDGERPVCREEPGVCLAKGEWVDVAEQLQGHDYGRAFRLEVGRDGGALLRAKADPRLAWTLPLLPLHTLQQELFPGTTYQRIRMPQEFQAVHVQDLPRKRAGRADWDTRVSHWWYMGTPLLAPLTPALHREHTSMYTSMYTTTTTTEPQSPHPPEDGRGSGTPQGGLGPEGMDDASGHEQAPSPDPPPPCPPKGRARPTTLAPSRPPCCRPRGGAPTRTVPPPPTAQLPAGPGPCITPPPLPTAG